MILQEKPSNLTTEEQFFSKRVFFGSAKWLTLLAFQLGIQLSVYSMEQYSS
jgi:hypothetical protein